jgi:hypothetical protein
MRPRVAGLRSSIERLGRGPDQELWRELKSPRGEAKSVADGRRWKRLGVRTDDGMADESEPVDRNDFFRRPDGIGASPFSVESP